MYTGIMLKFENGLEVGYQRGVRSPSSYTVDTGDMDLNAKRSISGYMNRNRIRGGSTTVYSVSVSWDRITWEELTKLIAAGDPEEFDLTVLDPKGVGGFVTKRMYRDANMSYSLKNIYSEKEAYWTTNMVFVEL